MKLLPLCTEMSVELFPTVRVFNYKKVHFEYLLIFPF